MLQLLQAALLTLALVLAMPALAQWTPGGHPPLASVVGSVEWNDLTLEQKTALHPLAELWPTLSLEHQRKWLALAHNFSRMPLAEQTTLQSRMTEWANLTPAQRTQARLNFGEVRKVPADERRAKWEEYQALPAEERERLANDRPKPPVSAAPALRPVPPGKILRPARPVAAPSASAASGAARPALPVNRHTLLPQPPASAPAR